METTFKELAKISEHNLYRLIVDGALHHRETGWHGYAERETGCLSDAFKGLAFGLQDIENKALSTTQIKTIHGLITNRLLGQLPEKFGVLSGGYRPYSTTFGVAFNENITESGFKKLMQEMQEYKQNADEKDRALGSRFVFEPPRTTMELHNEIHRNLPEAGGSEEEIWTAILQGRSLGKPVCYKAPEPELVSELMEEYVASYNEQIKLALSDEQKLRVIIEHVQKIEQLHPFQDGNLRTSIVLLQRLLIQNNFYPVMLREPNIFDAYDIDAIIEEVNTGMENTKRIIQNPDEELFGFQSIPFDDKRYDGMEVFNTDYYDAITEMRQFHRFVQEASAVLSIADGNTLTNKENAGHSGQVPTCSSSDLVSQGNQTSSSTVQGNDPDARAAYIELLSILKSNELIDDGARLKQPLYPNLYELIKAVEQFEDIAVIKAIAEKGIELNMQKIESDPQKVPEQLNNRLAIFQSIKKASTIEHVLGIINHEHPHLIKNNPPPESPCSLL